MRTQACGLHGNTVISVWDWDLEVQPGVPVSRIAAVLVLKAGSLTTANITQASTHIYSISSTLSLILIPPCMHGRSTGEEEYTCLRTVQCLTAIE